MGKILYIGESIGKISSGGDVVNERNRRVLNIVFGADFFEYRLRHVNKIVTFFHLLQGNPALISFSDCRRILRMIDRNGIGQVFLGSSKYGKLASLIKRNHPSVRVITFFHNIERQYYEEELRIENRMKTRFVAHVVAKNECRAVSDSDTLITLNRRDSALLKRIYGRNADFELPMSFPDCYDADRAAAGRGKGGVEKPFKILFVGNNFFANNQGVSWFIREVLPALGGATLTIVGKGMDSVFQSRFNVEVTGYVADLSPYYYSADAVVVPIFSGGGMKTKTAEAMMYGCPVVGTTEAFEGYDVDYERIGGLANTAEEMIEKLNRLRDNGFSEHCRSYARSEFLEKYSLSSSLRLIERHLVQAGPSF